MLDSAYIDSLQVHRTATYAISQAGGFGSPAPRSEVFDYARRHGSLDLTRFYDGRVFSLEGYVRGETATDVLEAIDALKAALILGTSHTFTWTREGYGFQEQAAVTIASPLEVTLGPTRRSLKWAVDLFAGDPRLYSATLSRSSYDPAAASTGKGLRFPLVFPLVFEGEGATAVLEVENGGTMDTPPVYVITGPVENPVIDNETTGRSIYTRDLVLAAGETALVDVAGRVLKAGGQVALTYSTVLEGLGPAAWFKMDEADETSGVLADSSGNGHAATWLQDNGANFRQPGPLSSETSYAIEFTSNPYATLGDVFDFDGQAPFTVMAWVKPTLDGVPRRIFSTEYDPGTGRVGWSFSYSDTLSQLSRISSGSQNANGSPLTEGVWAFLVGTFDGQTSTIYEDAVVTGSTSPGSPKSLPLEPGDLYLGARPDTLGAKANGFLSHAAIFDRALTAAEVSTLYSAALSGQAASEGVPRADLLDAKLTLWGSLAPGPNRIRLRGDGMVSGETSLEVSWRDARV